MTKLSQVETALHEAAKLLYSWEQKMDYVGKPNIHRQALNRCARDAGHKDLEALYQYVDGYWREQDELWEGVYP